MTVTLAHGVLGNWDEIILLGIAVIFIIIMGIAWVNSRNTTYEFDDDPAADKESPDSDSSPERFRLD